MYLSNIDMISRAIERQTSSSTERVTVTPLVLVNVGMVGAQIIIRDPKAFEEGASINVADALSKAVEEEEARLQSVGDATEKSELKKLLKDADKNIKIDHDSVFIQFADKGSQTDETMIECIKKFISILTKHYDLRADNPMVCTFDGYIAHLHPTVLDQLRRNHIAAVVIPSHTSTWTQVVDLNPAAGLKNHHNRNQVALLSKLKHAAPTFHDKIFLVIQTCFDMMRSGQKLCDRYEQAIEQYWKRYSKILT